MTGGRDGLNHSNCHIYPDTSTIKNESVRQHYEELKFPNTRRKVTAFAVFRSALILVLNRSKCGLEQWSLFTPQRASSVLLQ